MTGGLSIAAMLGELGLDPKKVAVERNLEIVPRGTLGDVEGYATIDPTSPAEATNETGRCP